MAPLAPLACATRFVRVPQFVIRPMAAADAQAIAQWRYPAPYSFYDADADPDDLAELLEPSEWGRRYFAATDADGQLVGLFVFKVDGGVVEIGLGLRPDLTGQGLGASFVEAGMRHASVALGATELALAVAAFNRRAITVYERAGFREFRRYDHATNGGVHEFVWMTRRPLPWISGHRDRRW
jgi:ribosomal-protein-alanine N-acetyltransferase